MNFVRHFLRAVVAGVLACVILEWAASPARQVHAVTDWYVSTTGSDSPGCGSSTNPCRSIAYVLTAVPGFADGDVIRVSGTLAENVNLGRSAAIIGQTADATIQAASAGSVISVSAGVSATLSGLTIRNGNAANGGGIRNEGTLIASNVVVTANLASSTGGGIYNAGTLTMTNGRIAGNRIIGAGEAGGGIENVGALFVADTVIEHNKGGSYGGGIENFGGQAKLVRVVIRKNEAASGGGIENGSAGALVIEASAIVENAGSNQGGGINNSSTLVLRNVTLSGNSLLAGPGAGLQNASGGNASLSFVSIVSNTVKNTSNADVSGLSSVGSTVALTATVIAYNAARNCYAESGGTFQSFNYNVSSDNKCDFLTEPQDASNVNPKLAALKFANGTYTHALLQGSPLLDVVDPAACLPADQREVARPQGAKCDVGAHEATAAELNSADLELSTVAPASVPRSSGYSITLQVKNLGPNDAQSPVVATTLPANAEFISAGGGDWSCALSGITLTCSYQLSHMPIGSAPVIVIALKAPVNATTLTATAVVSTLSVDPDLNNNTVTATSSVIITDTKVYLPIIQR